MSTAKMVNSRSTSTTVQTDLSGWREGGREGEREGGREGGKERGRERGKKGGRKGEREEGREVGRERSIPHDLHRSSTTNMNTCIHTHTYNISHQPAYPHKSETEYMY